MWIAYRLISCYIYPWYHNISFFLYVFLMLFFLKDIDNTVLYAWALMRPEKMLTRMLFIHGYLIVTICFLPLIGSIIIIFNDLNCQSAFVLKNSYIKWASNERIIVNKRMILPLDITICTTNRHNRCISSIKYIIVR